MNRADFYQSLNNQLIALLEGQSNWITNLSQFSAFLNMSLEDINWVGFYLTDKPEQLKLGPFQGNVACVDIPFGKGVCGTAAKEKRTLVVEDVDQFSGHIACDARSRSEVVCPIIIDDKTVGVLDIDSPSLKRFDDADGEGLQLLVKTLLERTDWPKA
ncbi:MAG: GAF domain-containing protein [Kangiellaceae bacterium]|nr:GAF domain-containing protein [Kangiellaceae bacterium]MCW8999763.1 GAF domain-containing protein [Kangiellaceae bacterium]